MIGKIIIGSAFGPCISYVLEGRKEDQLKMKGEVKGTILNYNYCFGNKSELIEQFNEIRKLNPKVSRAVSHSIISFDPQDKVSDEQMVEIASKLASKMGFDKNQYIVVKHEDTGHSHLHVVSNRISFDGKTQSDSNNYKRISEFCREMEKEYKFKEVLSPRRFLPKDQKNIERHDTRFEDCKQVLKSVLPKCSTWDELQYKLLARGIMMEKGRGIAFIDEKAVRIKGSKIGFSFEKIESLLRKKQEVPDTKETNQKLRIRI